MEDQISINTERIATIVSWLRWLAGGVVILAVGGIYIIQMRHDVDNSTDSISQNTIRIEQLRTQESITSRKLEVLQAIMERIERKIDK